MTDMTPEKITQRLKRVAQLRRLCLNLSSAGKSLAAQTSGGGREMLSASHSSKQAGTQDMQNHDSIADEQAAANMREI